VWIAWIVILASVALMAGTTYVESRKPPAPVQNPAREHSVQLQLVARSLVYAHSQDPKTSAQATGILLAQMNQFARDPVDRLREAVVLGEVQGGKQALQSLDALGSQRSPPGLDADVDILRTIYTRGVDALTPDQRHRLLERHEWFGQLALAYHEPAGNPDRAGALAAAAHTVHATTVGVAIGAAVLLVSLGLFITAIVRIGDRKVRRHYVRPRAPAGPFVEAFAIYLGGLALLSSELLRQSHFLARFSLFYFVAMFAIPIVAICWPRWRGVSRAAWREGLGWHTGTRGALAEIGFGMCGYLAGLPIVIVGGIVMMVLNKLAGASPTHPIVNEAGGNTAEIVLLLLLGAVYAPIFEETMFRGALFNFMRERFGWTLSSSVVSLIFAAVHPQGWTVIPVLFAIAMVLNAIREWRGTILASAAAHALNNGALLTFVVVLLK
jgi:membrane protease YdiL (CAAX protease family)